MQCPRPQRTTIRRCRGGGGGTRDFSCVVGGAAEGGGLNVHPSREGIRLEFARARAAIS